MLHPLVPPDKTHHRHPSTSKDFYRNIFPPTIKSTAPFISSRPLTGEECFSGVVCFERGVFCAVPGRKTLPVRWSGT